MRQLLTINPTGLMNRRDLVTRIGDDQVLTRENFRVIGLKDKRNKKIPGSDRYNTTSVGSDPVVWMFRYYTKLLKRKNFFFSGGGLYHIDDSGNTTLIIGTFNPEAYPCAVEVRVSDNDTLLFSEGVDTGMYSHDGNDAQNFAKENAVTLNFVGMISHLDRVFAFEEDSEELHYSKNLEFTNYTDSTDAGTIIIGAKRGSKIQQIIVHNETIYIFKTDSIWVLEGDSPSNFVVREVHPYMGLAARRSLVSTGTVLIGYMSDYEVYSFGGTVDSMKLLSYNIALGGDLTKDLVPIVNRDRVDQINAEYHNGLYRMAFTLSGETQNKWEYCFDTTNSTDFFTKDNNVSSYLKYIRYPDKNELVTGRSDVGRLMHQNRGINFDNQDTALAMHFKIQTKFVGLGEEPRNFRVKKVWIEFGALGTLPMPVKYYLDTRHAASDVRSDSFTTKGEQKSVTSFIKVNAQSAFTSRQVLKWGGAKGQNISLAIDEQIRDVDLEFSTMRAEVITKNLKRSEKVGV